MTQEEFISKYEEEKLLYEAWGNYILETISSQVKDISFQIEPKVRLKDTESLIGKAFYRGKNYTDPYSEITDKVGLRFVLLLGSEISIIDEIINKSSDWCASKDRDFERERLDEPLAFDYQSMHYILTSKSKIEINNLEIPIGITCELQIRTLLQHAYSELSHSRIYKPSFDPTAKVKRVVAKSMALLETTDEYFEEVNSQMNKIVAFTLLDKLSKLLEETMEHKINVSTEANYYIMDAFSLELENNIFLISNIAEFSEIVKNNFNKTFLNTQPIIFFIYFMIINYKETLLSKWSLTREELRPLFNQLGVSINDLS